MRGRFAAAVRRLLAPVVDQQQAFNAAVVDHINRSIPVQRETRASIESTLAVLRAQLTDLVRFQSLLVMYLQRITPYVDTRDRDVAGLLRGLSGAINAVSDELMKRSEAVLSREQRHDAHLAALELAVAALGEQTRALTSAIERAAPSGRIGGTPHQP